MYYIYNGINGFLRFLETYQLQNILKYSREIEEGNKDTAVPGQQLNKHNKINYTPTTGITNGIREREGERGERGGREGETEILSRILLAIKRISTN